MLTRMPSGQDNTYFEGEADKAFNVASMKKYATNKQEMDKALEEMIRPFLASGSPSVIDACCGVGHVISFLSEMNPDATFLGVDQTPYLIEEAKKLNEGKKNVSFEAGDLFDLPAIYPKRFDLSINWKTLSWLPSYEDALKALFAVTKKHVFVSSLFYDGDIDFEIKVRQHKKEQDGFHYYNIYSLPRFIRFAEAHGAKHVEVADFHMPLDLPRGDVDHMGTYTVPLADGSRLQMSGAVPMLWKLIRIDLE
ncbi:MAG: class I SAM-dependent methyltransferase [Candidatus Uhrbacteria bacterium]|nr:class I SAM-dependent methyltransferase [Candidatus Uhrbacteria bacterium]